MPLSSIGDGGVHDGGGWSFCKCEVHDMCNPSLFGDFPMFCGPAFFLTRADLLSRVRIFYYACRYCYDLMLCKKIESKLKTLNKVYKVV